MGNFRQSMGESKLSIIDYGKLKPLKNTYFWFFISFIFQMIFSDLSLFISEA